MHKVLIIALGLASLGTFASVQPASAAKKKVCQTAYMNTDTRQSQACNTIEGRNKYHCTTKLVNGLGLQVCFDIDVPPTPTAPWTSGAPNFTRPPTASTALKNR